MPYFNYRVHMVPAAEASAWQRREFIHAWWKLYAKESHLTPPDFGRLTRELQPRHNPHLARMRPLLIHIDALHRSGMGTPQPGQPLPLVSIIERPLAAAVVLQDPRRNDKTGYLALLQTANDAEALERLLDAVSEIGRHSGMRRLLLSTGLSPHLGTGIQTDAWNLAAPHGAPSNPPYLPDLLHDLARPIQTAQVYHAPIAAEPTAVSGPATLHPLDPERLTTDLLALFAATQDNSMAGFALPDVEEAALLLRWLGAESLSGWVAERNGRPVGFALLGPDWAALLRRHNGGKRLHRRPLLRLGLRLGSAAAGRVYFGGVLPDERRQGIGRQLWDVCLRTAITQGWQSLTVGPVWASATRAFLVAQGAAVMQSAELFEAVI